MFYPYSAKLNKLLVLCFFIIFIKEMIMGLHIKDIFKLMEVFIEARDMLADKKLLNKRIDLTISKMDKIIKESHEEKNL
jgi:hypothetical protein